MLSDINAAFWYNGISLVLQSDKEKVYGKPLLCQLEITYKQEPGGPKSLMTFTDWTFDPKIEAGIFQHRPANFCELTGI
jgi:hypothetical protein